MLSPALGRFQLWLCLILLRLNAESCSTECRLPPGWRRGFGVSPLAPNERGVRGGTVGSPASLSLCGILFIDVIYTV